jgi:hypothetical protein
LGSVGCRGLPGERCAEEECDFTPDGFFFERSREFGKRAATELFVELSDFTGEAGRAITEDFEGVCDRFGDAVGRLVEDKGAVLDAKALEGAAAFAGARGEKADEEELFIGQARGRKRREKCGRTGNWNDRDLMAGAESNKAIAGVADEWHACVADESYSSALLHGNDELGGSGHFVVFVIADERFADFVVREEFLRVTGVFAGDLVGFLEDAESAKSDVLEIADGCTDKVETAAGIGGRGLHGGSLAWRFD